MIAPLTVGQFTWNLDGSISGPATYMQEQGSAWIARVNAGDLPMVVREGYRQNGGNVELAILVGLQTDYAGWKGYRQMFGAA
jgi:hypothetical protein